MKKYFRDISIHTDSNQILPANKKEKDFNISTHTVRDIFFYSIPEKFELNKIEKLNILITDKVRRGKFIVHFDGIAIYNYSGFNFLDYFNRSGEEKNIIILNILRETISDICQNDKDKLTTLLQITDDIEKNNFSLTKVSKGLSRQSRNKKLKATVIYTVDNKGQNAYLEISDAQGKKLLNSHLLKNELFEFHNNLWVTEWIGNKFRILNRYGDIFKEFEVIP